MYCFPFIAAFLKTPAVVIFRPQIFQPPQFCSSHPCHPSQNTKPNGSPNGTSNGPPKASPRPPCKALENGPKNPSPNATSNAQERAGEPWEGERPRGEWETICSDCVGCAKEEESRHQKGPRRSPHLASCTSLHEMCVLNYLTRIHLSLMKVCFRQLK